MLRYLLAVSALLIATSSLAQQDEVYMENQAGGYLALTHEECKVEEIRDTFPYHAYGVDQTNEIVGMACYQIPALPSQEEMSEVPQGMSIIPVVNLIDLMDGEIHTLQASWFTSTKPGQL
jgi:hypothetical protein